MKKIRFGGMTCGCGSNNLKLNTTYTGRDWACEEGEKSGYDFEVFLACQECGRLYHIGNTKNEYAISEAI